MGTGQERREEEKGMKERGMREGNEGGRKAKEEGVKDIRSLGRESEWTEITAKVYHCIFFLMAKVLIPTEMLEANIILDFIISSV